jgi:hypothetical protein
VTGVRRDCSECSNVRFPPKAAIRLFVRFRPKADISLLNDSCYLPAMSEAEVELAAFIDKFDSANQNLIRSVRSALRKQLPGCAELVWDNYNFFVIGYSPTERPSDYLVSIAASANGVSLSFNRGAELPDPDHVLQGSSKVNRFIRVPSMDVLGQPEVKRIIQIASDQSDVPRPWQCGGKLIIRSVSHKQRPRRRPS